MQRAIVALDAEHRQKSFQIYTTNEMTCWDCLSLKRAGGQLRRTGSQIVAHCLTRRWLYNWPPSDSTKHRFKRPLSRKLKLCIGSTLAKRHRAASSHEGSFAVAWQTSADEQWVPWPRARLIITLRWFCCGIPLIAIPPSLTASTYNWIQTRQVAAVSCPAREVGLGSREVRQ